MFSIHVRPPQSVSSPLKKADGPVTSGPAIPAGAPSAAETIPLPEDVETPAPPASHTTGLPPTAAGGDIDEERQTLLRRSQRNAILPALRRVRSWTSCEPNSDSR